ncbi:MAG: hypothetical protein IPO78_07545 [Saprospiraceae bacterium]|nr:hypothetical protein [Saprospiraceae bacterium]MBK8449732.1 hypothetical protein [Saprospiraceae bacterium]MBK9221601.1 hypothetical protein [Saprospiraceae bacterium]MBK9721461.1 hypothetical protein [Saprospiraceae bacterium]MBK9728526.1 hypothetical protein [Saprospiraceae bacterium]
MSKEFEKSDSYIEFELKAGIDYYIENGYFVFTADFLKRRGFCCGSGCRHCPYKL